ncbi:MAG: acetyl-CoA carboxylase carboxyl transferase subunit beta [Verrucomicrobiales bacterium]|jgi:acetyl-CoA carboxylase carboxyl transferase subunit beta
MATTSIASPGSNDPDKDDSSGLSKEASEIFRRMNPAIFDDPQLADEDGFFRRRDLSGFGEKKKDMPEGLWHKCPACSAVIHEFDLTENLRVCNRCNYHYTMSSEQRIALITDEGSFEAMDDHLKTVDALNFKSYVEKVEKYQKRTGLSEAVVTGRATIHAHPVTVSVMDFRFLGASMGSVVGEKITRAIELATAERRGVIIFSASGGARMHEGILSLMQMAKTSGALARHGQAGLPYISVLTHPTTGGVTASFATLGDVIIAEPRCMIGFAGPRVVKETTHQDLPEGFQTAEFMLQHGLVDRIVERKDLRDGLGALLSYMMPDLDAESAPVAEASTEEE